MKKLVFASLALFVCSVFFATGVFALEKVACVDLARIFSEYSKTKDYDKTLGDKQTSYDKEREKKVNEIKQFQDKINLLSDKEKENKRPEMENKIKALQEYDRQKQTDLRKEQDERMKEILKDIEETVKQFAEKEGYTLILNVRVLVYQVKSMDITDPIVELLNKAYKKR